MSTLPSSPESTSELSSALLDEVTTEVFGTMFGMATERAPDTIKAEPEAPCSYIGIGGSWQGTVWVKAMRSLLVDMVTLVHDIPEDEVDDEITMDTLSELANMIGGSFKAKLGSGCQLSLPKLLLAADEAPCPSRGTCLTYLVEGQMVQVFIDGALAAQAKAA